MTSDDYNRRELDAGRITVEHITELTRAYQAQRGLTVDGKLGPATRASLKMRSIVGLGGADAAIAWAREQHRLWTTPAGATAKQHAEYRDGLVRSYFAEEKRHPNWCAAFVASALEAGGVPVPRKGAERRGAQALTKWVAQQGEPITAAQDLEPGDVICWRRTLLGWEGHVALVLRVFAEDLAVNVNGHRTLLAEGGSIEIADPNVDGGQLAIRTLGPKEWPTRLKGLYGVARPNYGGAR